VSDDEIIHFAGQTMTFGAIRRQRCLWCGALIQEYDLGSVAISDSGRAPERRGKPLEADEIGHWSGLVGVSGTNPRMYRAVDDPDDGKAPDRSCMVLMPEEIGVR
jgi:hypothetical protein